MDGSHFLNCCQNEILKIGSIQVRSPPQQMGGIGQHPHGPKSPKLQAYSGRKELGQQLSCKVFQVALPTSSGQELVNSLQNYKRSQAYRYIYNHIYILVHVQYYLCVYMYIRSGHPKAYNVCIFFCFLKTMHFEHTFHKLPHIAATIRFQTYEYLHNH